MMQNLIYKITLSTLDKKNNSNIILIELPHALDPRSLLNKYRLCIGNYSLIRRLPNFVSSATSLIDSRQEITPEPHVLNTLIDSLTDHDSVILTLSSPSVTRPSGTAFLDGRLSSCPSRSPSPPSAPPTERLSRRAGSAAAPSSGWI